MTGYESKRAMAQDKLKQEPLATLFGSLPVYDVPVVDELPAQELVAHMEAIDQLKSVLCDPEGKCCIAGSDEDRAIVDRALAALAQPAQEPVREALKLALDAFENASFAKENKAIAAIKAALAQPAQRPLVDLTDADWKEIEDMPDTFDQGVAWCLARLKERNA